MSSGGLDTLTRTPSLISSPVSVPPSATCSTINTLLRSRSLRSNYHLAYLDHILCALLTVDHSRRVNEALINSGCYFLCPLPYSSYNNSSLLIYGSVLLVQVIVGWCNFHCWLLTNDNEEIIREIRCLLYWPVKLFEPQRHSFVLYIAVRCQSLGLEFGF